MPWDYLVKPIEFERFRKAVKKAVNYHALLTTGEKENIENVENNYLLVKSERRYFKVNFEDILFYRRLERLRDSPAGGSTRHHQNEPQSHPRTTPGKSLFQNQQIIYHQYQSHQLIRQQRRLHPYPRNRYRQHLSGMPFSRKFLIKKQKNHRRGRLINIH